MLPLGQPSTRDSGGQGPSNFCLWQPYIPGCPPHTLLAPLVMLTASTSANSAVTAHPTLRQTCLGAVRHMKADSLLLREDVVRTQKWFDNARFTYFNTGPNYCGGVDQDDIPIVRLSPSQWNGGTQCNTSVTLQYQGASFVARITGLCPGCPSGDLDLSPGLFERLSGDLDLGEVQGSWTFGNELAAGTSDNPTSTSISSVITPSTSSPIAPSTTLTPTANSHSATSSPAISASGTTTVSSSTSASSDVQGSTTPVSVSSHPPSKALIIALPIVLVLLGILIVAFAFGRRRRLGGKPIVPLDFRAPPPLSDARKGIKLTGGEFAIGGSSDAALHSRANSHAIPPDFPLLSDTPSYASQDRPFSLHSTYAHYSDSVSPYDVSAGFSDHTSVPWSSRGLGHRIPSAVSYVPSTVTPRTRPPKTALSPNPRVPRPESSLSTRETRVVIDHAPTASTAIEHGRGVVVLPASLEERFLAFLRSASPERQRRESVELAEPLPAYEPRRSPELTR